MFVFKILIGKNEIYYQTRLGGGHIYNFSNIRGVWISSNRVENYCTFKLANGTVIKFPFYANDYQAIVFKKKQVEARNTIFDEKIGLDYYEITDKNYGKLYIVQEPLILRYMGIIACILVIAILFVRYKYLDVKIDRDGFSFQTGSFNKKYYKYTDIVSCNEITKKIRTGKYKIGGTIFYQDYFLFTDKNDITSNFNMKNTFIITKYIFLKRESTMQMV